MTIEYKCEHTDRVDPATLKPHPKNPNKHPSKQIEALCGNIERFGWRHPIVVSKSSGLIICGHARQQAAVKLGCDAPVDCQDFDDETAELAVLMADNVIPELAEMDQELKIEALEELKIHDVDLEIIGVELPETSKNGSDDEVDYDSKYIVEIECESELQQNEAFTKLTKEGFKCRVLKL